MKRHLLTIGLVALAATSLPACKAPGATKDAKRGAIMRMHDEALERATHKWPHLDNMIDESHGYAVVNGGVLKAFFVGLSSGYGVVVDQNQRTHTMIDTFALSLGPGFELSNTNGIVVFHSKEGLELAKKGELGWVFGGTAGLGIEVGDLGGDWAIAGVSGATTSFRDMRWGLGIHAQFFGMDTDLNEALE